MDAELRIWPGVVAFGIVLACVLSCSPSKPPCNEDKMKAIDVAYLKDLAKACLQYPSAAECPDYPALKLKHERELESCPQ